MKGKLVSFRWVAVNARMGVANASPVRTATRMASSARPEWTVPKSSMTRKNAQLPSASRKASQPNSPANTSSTPIGVASMPS